MRPETRSFRPVLILTFFNAAGLFLLLGAEFLAMILVVVYVGAVAVLFLFVVMMLDVDFAELRRELLQVLADRALVGVIFLAELLLVCRRMDSRPRSRSRLRRDPADRERALTPKRSEWCS